MGPHIVSTIQDSLHLGVVGDRDAGEEIVGSPKAERSYRPQQSILPGVLTYKPVPGFLSPLSLSWRWETDVSA